MVDFNLRITFLFLSLIVINSTDALAKATNLNEQNAALPPSVETLEPPSSSIQISQATSRPPAPSDKPINVSGRLIYIVCFYGDQDHGNVASQMCEQKYRECIQAYGAPSCKKLINPSSAELNRIKNEGLVVVVTHTTPDADVDCRTGIGIWDAKPGVTPSKVCDSVSAPVIWYGCFGKSVADQCPNAIPLADVPAVLDSRDPMVACRYRATTACIEELIKSGRSPSQKAVSDCVKNKMQLLCPQK